METRTVTSVSIRFFGTDRHGVDMELSTVYGDTPASVTRQLTETVNTWTGYGYTVARGLVSVRYSDDTDETDSVPVSQLHETIVRLFAMDSVSTETETETETMSPETLATLTENAKRYAREHGLSVHIPTGTPLAGFAFMRWSDGHTYGYGYSVETFDAAVSDYNAHTTVNRAIFGIPFVTPETGRDRADTVAIQLNPDGSDVVAVRNGNGHASFSETVRNALRSFLGEAVSYQPGYKLATALLDTGTLHYIRASMETLDTSHGQTVRDSVTIDVHAAQTWTRKASYVNVSDDGKMLSYLPASKITRDILYQEYDANGRQSAKPSKVFRMVLRDADCFTDADYEAVTNAIRAYVQRSLGTFEIVSGNAIRDAYHQDEYGPDNMTGTLANSCMRYPRCQSFFRLYTDNPDTVSLLTYRNEDGELLGRALLWQLDNGKTYMDRVYGNDVVQRIFDTYATEQGYTDDAECVSVKHADFDEYPYMDTYRYLQPDTGTLASDPGYLPDGRYYELDSTSGYYTTYNATRECSECGSEYDSDDDNGYGLCEGCYTDRSCQHCGCFDYSDDHTDGFCARCIDGYRCTDCGHVVADRYDLTGGYCSECVSDHVCTECGDVDDNRDANGLCDNCMERQCIVCGRFRTWSEYGDDYARNPVRADECETCQRQPRLFDIPAAHSVDAGTVRSWYPFASRIPATGNVCIVDTETETPSETRYPMFYDSLPVDVQPGTPEWTAMPSYRYRYTPLAIDAATYARHRYALREMR